MTDGSASVSSVTVLQSRGIGATEAFREFFPPWGVEAFGLLTHLGDVWLLVTLGVLVYWGYDRRAGGFVLGSLFVGFAIVIALKAVFALPRPPADLQSVIAYGYGFPSGHAVTVTVGWGALAAVLDRDRPSTNRIAGVGVIVVLVALSRVVIGVHYLVDVIAGVAIGLAVLGVAVRWGRDNTLGLFLGAGGLAGAVTIFSEGALEAVVLLGACTGAVVAWQMVESADRRWDRGFIASAAGTIALLAAIGVAMAPVVSLTFAGVMTATVGVFLVPTATSRWSR